MYYDPGIIMTFSLPSAESLENLGDVERMNTFRRFFALSRYGRLLAQQMLVRSVADPVFLNQVASMEEAHRAEFAAAVEKLKETRYFAEFANAAAEEEQALKRIIEAYDERMARGQ